MADETPNPATPSSDYEAQKDYWQMVSAILAGAPAMRVAQSWEKSQWGPAQPYGFLNQLARGGTLRGSTAAESPYLPKFQNETDRDYEHRRRHAPLANLYSDISSNLANKPFAKELKLEEGSSGQLDDLAANIDRQGNNLHVFAGNLFKAGIDNGIDWILIEYTNVAPGATLADERQMGAGPYWCRVPAERMLAVYSDFVNGEEIIHHARIYEPITVAVGYGEVCKERVRYLYREPTLDATGRAIAYGPAQWELWEQQETGKDAGGAKTWAMIDGGPITIGIIPLVPFIPAGRCGASWRVEPPLRDLAYMQVEEFQQESNLKTIKELTAFPMVAGNGVQGTNADGSEMVVPVGPRAVLFAPPGGDGDHGEWTFIEPSAASLTFLQADLEKHRSEMRALGLQPMASANLTVVTTANVSMKASSHVQAWALRLKDVLERAWRITGLWLGQPDLEVDVKVHTDFAVELEQGKELDALLKAQTQGIFSKETVREEFKRRGIIGDDVDLDEEEEKLAKDQEGLMAEKAIDPVTGRPLGPLPYETSNPEPTLQ